MRMELIRHGLTAGNLRSAYIGSTDEPLCEEGMKEVREKVRRIRMHHAREEDLLLAVSPMLRCRQTAQLWFPGQEQIIVRDFRECDFGAFEGKNAEELTGDPAFQGWIDSGGSAPFPGGEDPAAFRERCGRAFAAFLKERQGAGSMAFVVHGGVIMALMERYAEPHRPFYDWHIGNAEGFSAVWDGAHLTQIERI